MKNSLIFVLLFSIAISATARDDGPIQSFCASQGATECQQESSESISGKLEGAAFRLFSESASVEAVDGQGAWIDASTRWSIGCRKDKMDGRKLCYVARGDLWIFLYQGGRESVSVGTSHYPSSLTSIRIGARRFDTTDGEGFFQQRALIPALKDGTIVVTRFMKWPYKHWVDDEFKLHGAQASLKIARWLLKNGDIK